MAKGRHSRGRHRDLGGQLPQTAPPESATGYGPVEICSFTHFEWRTFSKFSLSALIKIIFAPIVFTSLK